MIECIQLVEHVSKMSPVIVNQVSTLYDMNYI